MSPSPSPQSPRFDSLHQEAYLHLWRTYDRLKKLEDEVFEKYEISAQQYNALRLLGWVHPAGMPILALGAKLISRAPDMTRLIDKLERRGFVVRARRAENRRVVETAITTAGLALLEELERPVRACAERQLGHLSEASLRELIMLLKQARAPHERSGTPREAAGDSA